MASLIVTALANPHIQKIFGEKAQEVGDLIKKFDFKSIDTKDITSQDYFNYALAPSFGDLTDESFKAMDEELKVMMAGTIKVLENQPDKSWKSVLATMMTNKSTIPDEEEIYNVEHYTHNTSSWFQFDHKKDQTVVNAVLTWFDNLISDSDIRKSTQIDINVMADIVATTGAIIEGLASIAYKHEYHEKNLLEIGVLRYPDIQSPYFKLYRIKLKAYADATRTLIKTEDKNGIMGEFNCRKFRPRKEVIAKLSKQAVDDAVDFLEGLFTSK